MKTILLFDYYMPIAHKKLNQSIVTILSKEYKLIVLTKNGYIRTRLHNVRSIKLPLFDAATFKNKYVRLLLFIINFIIARISIIGKKYDKVIVLTYETLSMGYLYKLLPDKPICLFEHYNVDSISKERTKNIFLRYANTVSHFVFAPYIGDYLVSIGIDRNRVHYVPHPIFTTVCDSKEFNKSNSKIVLSPGLSNDTGLLNKIVEYENNNHVLENHNIILRYRVKQHNQCDIPPCIELVSGFYSEIEYEQLYNSSDAIMVVYPESYRYRFSSVLLNALTKNKVVIGNDIEIVRYFSNLYPNNVKLFSSIEELFLLITSDLNFDKKQGECFVRDFSDNSILSSMQKFIELEQIENGD